MNERIRQLAEQAYEYSDTSNSGELFEEKFAELIVKECAEIALREDHDPYECIKRHFGVK
jgi:hypothetical protein